MSRQINIDPEVEQALANRAIEEGLGVFSADTPNKILPHTHGLMSIPGQPLSETVINDRR